MVRRKFNDSTLLSTCLIETERASFLEKSFLDKKKRNSLIVAVVVLTLGRLTINMTRRFMYPFVPAIGEQLNVSVQSVQGVISAQSAVGMLSPVFGTLSERYGRKRTMVTSLLMICPAMILGALFVNFWIFAAMMIVVGLVKIVYDPTAQAYLGDRVPYHRRGLVWGILELNWAGSLIIIAPLAGFLLASSGLRSVLAFFAVMGVIAWAIVWRYLPRDHQGETSEALAANPMSGLRTLSKNPAGMGALAYSLFLVTANEMFFINYGVWMDTSFDLVLTGLGFVTITIAIAEVIGELCVVAIADKVGKRNMALVGAVGSSFVYLALPYLTFSLYAAMVGVFVLFVFFEVAIVASIPLFTEIMPDARAVMMSSNISAHALGRLSGSALGGLLYAWLGDFTLVGGLAMVCGLGACAVMWHRVPEISAPNAS